MKVFCYYRNPVLGIGYCVLFVIKEKHHRFELISHSILPSISSFLSLLFDSHQTMKPFLTFKVICKREG